jgi:hypothetical protein
MALVSHIRADCGIAWDQRRRPNVLSYLWLSLVESVMSIYAIAKNQVYAINLASLSLSLRREVDQPKERMQPAITRRTTFSGHATFQTNLSGP